MHDTGRRRQAGRWGVVAAVLATAVALVRTQPAVLYHLESPTGHGHDVQRRFSDDQLGILEKINRADRDHLARLDVLVVPRTWEDDELAYSPLPARYAAAASARRLLVLYLPGQAFGGYELGTLVRWGPVSSGRRTSPTPAGTYHLNWRSTGHASTVDPDWFMPWYFNFQNAEGAAFHQYALPGRPASHGCVRLLERDAVWLFGWGDTWTLESGGTRILRPGTPVLIVGAYDFDAPPPWRSLDWLAAPIELPPAN